MNLDSHIRYQMIYISAQQIRKEKQEMKQPKRLTLSQKKILKDYRLVPDNWMLVEEDMNSITVINKKTNKRRVLLK